MCKVLRTIGADVLDAELPVGQADTAFTLRGDLRDPGLDAELGHIVDAPVGAALDGRGRPPRETRDAQAAGADRTGPHLHGTLRA